MARAGWFGVRDFASNKASGILLVMSGLALAAYAMPSGVDTEMEAQAQFTQRPDPPATLVRDRPSVPAANTSAPAAGAALQAPVAPVPQGRLVPQQTAAGRPLSAPPPATVAPPPGRVSLPRAVPNDRQELARELQMELRRVGCFDGAVNGVWTSASRRAMKAFTEQVNATLPVDRPDAVLLVMVQNQAEPVCGAPCPAGQGADAEGRCLPNAILAKGVGKGSLVAAETSESPAVAAAEKQAPTVATWAATVAQARAAGRPRTAAAPARTRPVPAPVEGRMALAGPALASEAGDSARMAPPASRKVANRARAPRHARGSQRFNRYVAMSRRGGYARPFFLGWLF
jgi:hypothetical protein